MPQTSHEGSWCQASMGPALSFFFKLRSTAHRCGLWPVELWATHCVVQAQRQIHRFCRPPMTVVARARLRLPHYNDGIIPLRCDPWLEPIIDCGFDARRTSHPVAVPRTAGTTIPHSRGHRAREGGSSLYVGILQPLFVTVRPPGSNGADQALVELAIMLPILPNGLSLPS